MRNEPIVPVHHSTLSGVGATAAGGIGGAIKGGIGGYLVTTLAFAAAGAALAVAFAPLGVLGGIAIGGLVGGAAGGVLVAPTVGTLTSIVGAFTNGRSAAHRVYQEKGAATVLDAQVAAYQAQAAAAQTNIYTGAAAGRGANYSFPEQGSAMNPALSSVQADTAQHAGVMADRQLQRA